MESAMRIDPNSRLANLEELVGVDGADLRPRALLPQRLERGVRRDRLSLHPRKAVRDGDVAGVDDGGEGDAARVGHARLEQ
jgi:hypothetical protein